MTERSVLGLFRVSNFAPAFYLLPRSRRRALRAVYEFCRVVDDAVDDELDRRAAGQPPTGLAREILHQWRLVLREPFTATPGEHVNRTAWDNLFDVIENRRVPSEHLLALVDGVERDLGQKRYDAFSDLQDYCYGVAGTVGLACLPIFGLDELQHRDFAVSLGTAVQLINILRDVPEDARRDRIYLPREDLKRFGYSERELFDSVYNESFIRLMRFEASRSEEFYASALRALPPLSRRAARPALAMGNLYRTLLDEIRRTDFNVFESRPTLSVTRKLFCMGKVFWREWQNER